MNLPLTSRYVRVFSGDNDACLQARASYSLWDGLALLSHWFSSHIINSAAVLFIYLSGEGFLPENQGHEGSEAQA